MIHAGSLVSDASRKIAKIEYDYNNNPVRIQFTNGNVTKYIYSATGEKMRVIYQTAVANINVAIGETRELTTNELVNKKEETVDYLLGGTLTLKNGRIDKYQFDEGYCQAEKYSATQDDFTFCYYDKDHLGDIRQVTKADGTKKGAIIQKMNYYPFGAEFCDNTAKSYVQNHKYNGKEFDRMHGLNTYDYGARQYNPVTARWDRMDPLCEKYYNVSPYNYCHNNPVNRVDPNGKWDVNVHLATDRSKNGYGVAVVSDRNGQEIFKFIVRAEGVKGHNRMQVGADTPLGVYDIPDNNAWMKGGDRGAYGPNERLVMNPESGEIVESGRSDIRIHGGRQEKHNPDGSWSKNNTGLKKTFGCLRAYDEDMKTFKAFTDYLESTDDLEKPGKVIVKDDIEQYNKIKGDVEQYKKNRDK
jgi:RHS repeat-associated protein